MKLNALLAIEQHSKTVYSQSISQLVSIFKSKQGSFRGEHKTSVPREGYNLDYNKVSNKKVAFTVDEELDWFEKTIIPCLKNAFNKEATNSKGAAKVELVVNGISFGKATAAELMHLKGLLNSENLKNVYNSIPVRSETEVYTLSANPDYAKRGIVETAMVSDVSKTTEKEEVIIKDPNLDPQHLPSNYNAKTTIKSRQVIMSDDTRQFFSGEWTLERRADTLKFISDLREAVTKALQEVNDCEVVHTELDVEKLIKAIHGDIIRK